MHKLSLKNFIKYSCYIFFAFISIKALAQNEKPSSYFPNVVPPPPNSATLGRYGQVPLNQFTGNAHISIPLLDLKSNSLSLPISLSYCSDGIKVDQYESNVGMGWALNAGGVVTRQVQDYPDNYNGRMPKPNAAIDSSTMETFLNEASLGEQVDTQPDIFSYNMNGICGKFFLDNNNNPVEMEPSGLKIEITPDLIDLGFVPTANPEIIITDTKGIKYYFGGLNAVETSSTRRIFVENPGPPSDPIKTSWYLTKIENPTTKSIITLSYDTRVVSYITSNEQSLEYVYGFAGVRLTSALYNYQSTSRLNESLLKEITTVNSKVSFVYSQRFADPEFPLSKIDEIIYTTLPGSVIKKIKLDYDQYSGNTFSNTYNQSFAYFQKRFFLRQVNEFSTESEPVTHKFEYYSPEKLPARFSFAQDNYGVFNGKNNTSLISDEIPIFNSVLQAVPGGKLADRKPDGNFGYYGLLKKVIYPTKGSTTIEYEPHVLGKINVPVNAVKSSFSLSVSTVNEQFNNSSTSTIHSSMQQKIRINGSVVNNIDQCTEAENPFPLRAEVVITDLSTNLPVPFYKKGSNQDDSSLIANYYTFYKTQSVTEDTFTLEANKDYSVKISLIKPCMFGGVFFDYYSQPITYQEIEKEIGGQRIKSITKNNNINGIIEKERYYYRPYNCAACQSGSYINMAPIAYVKNIERSNPCEYPSQRILYSVGSSNLARLYSAQNAQFAYGYVTKSYGDNFENGGEEFQYEIIQDGLPLPTLGAMDKTTPFINGFGSGRLLSHKVLNKVLKVVKESTNTYYHDLAKDISINGYNAFMGTLGYAKVGTGTEAVCGLQLNWINYTLNEYSTRSQWHYLSQSIEKQYDINGQNPVTTTKTYNYSNANHLQLTAQTVKNSKGEDLQTRYYYAKDPEMANKPFVTELINANIIGVPLDTQTYNGASTKLSEQLTVYDKSISTNNLLLPKSIYAAKFPNAFPTVLIDKNLEKKITFDQYDDKGNILQYTQESGISVALIWGYNKTQPIAKIENATYSEVSSYAANLQTKSDTGTEADLITALTALRTALPAKMVTTFTYLPLIGVSTITDPKGSITTYLYDTYNRLKVVKDNSGKIISENLYHYQN
ncbi:hypothetical protein J2Y38_004551 [Flavobacterium sp. 2755]|uniref:hypothetical protein n=1 Tax=Flavobacterium sp. 2755 TaxID=2817765 RepID=UPI00286650DD|nr:hypothetical protein [Flavobacterium sp. 2755]MDR6764318.1 hypothetical protein [Flavobacterium sp. 2755]